MSKKKKEETAVALTTPVAPKLKGGNDEEVIARFQELFQKAQNGLRIVGAFALYAFHVKHNLLKHGQFGPWVEATYGKESYRAVRGHMGLCKSVLEKECKVKAIKPWIKNLADQIGKGSANLNHPGELLLLPEAKLPEKLEAARTKYFDTVDGKSANQLFMEFKQSDDDDEDNAKPKVGRGKGKGGATKAQREAAADKAEQARIEEIEISAGEFITWIENHADAKGFGCMNEELRGKLKDALELGASFLRRLGK